MGVRYGTRITRHSWISMPWWMAILLSPVLIPLAILRALTRR